MASAVYDFETKKKQKKPAKFRYVKMKVMENMKGETVGQTVKENICYSPLVKTDHYASYNKIKETVRTYIPSKVPPKEASKVLPWLHTMIANAKRTLLGVHHMISKKYIQDYLDEFCYIINR